MYRVQSLLDTWGNLNACNTASRTNRVGLVPLPWWAWPVGVLGAPGDVTDNLAGTLRINNLALPG